MRLLGPQLGKHVAHGLREHSGELVEERLVETERPPVAHGAAQDAAQHVVAVVVSGRDAVGHGETQCPRVVGEDAESDVDFFLPAVSGRAGFGER